jgi:ADP-heptose:LPS heptosyltransferase
MAEALHVTLRKRLSDLTNSSLSRLFPVNKDPDPIDKSAIKRILLVRINYRIGNILFTTPLLNALEKTFPNAKIDMMLGAPFISSLIEGMPQVNKVYAFPRELLKQPMKVLELKRELKNNHYDLLVTPSLMSSSDTLFTFLVSAKYKVGFYAPDIFSPLTHAVPFPENIEHEALKPLALMGLFENTSEEDMRSTLDIRLSKKEKEGGENDIPSHSIGIFRDARNEKKIDDDWWRALIKALHTMDTSLHFIDILDPNNTIALEEGMSTISEKNLRTLATKISNLDAFICGDTGPMHLASASGTATIALFKATSPTLYGTLGKKDLSLVMQGKSVEEVAHEIMAHLKSI